MVITKEILDELTETVKASSRLRMNYNFHEAFMVKGQR